MLQYDCGGKMKKYSPYSELKIFHHTYAIDALIKGERIAPIYVRIKPTNVCNQKCFYCGYADDSLYDGRRVDRRESIPYDIMERTLNELATLGTKAVTFSGGGEPLCYHSIDKTIELVRKLGLDYSLITNGQALEGSKSECFMDAKWIRVSLDSAKSATYESIRRVDTHKKVINNIESFVKMKSSECVLGINCVVTQKNSDEIFELCKLLKELGVDNIKLSPIMVKENEGDYHNAIKAKVEEQIFKAKQTLEDEHFRIVDKYTNDISIDNDYRKSYSRCLMQELFTVIAADSKVYRCHQRAYTPIGVIGDLTKQSFTDLWYSKSVIESVREFNPCEMCQFWCAFDERNMLLNDFLDIDQNHINFI